MLQLVECAFNFFVSNNYTFWEEVEMDEEMLLLLCASSVVAIIIRRQQNRRKNCKILMCEWLILHPVGRTQKREHFKLQQFPVYGCHVLQSHIMQALKSLIQIDQLTGVIKTPFDLS